MKNSIRTGITWGEFQHECDISNENSGKLRKEGGMFPGPLKAVSAGKYQKTGPSGKPQLMFITGLFTNCSRVGTTTKAKCFAMLRKG